MPEIKLMQGDCLEKMKEISDGSVDMILTDPPYGMTDCKWDSVIPFAPMWEQLNRIIKPNGTIALFGSEPFSSALNFSNIKNYKYSLVWKKSNKTGFLTAKKRPLKQHELISIFYKKQSTYNPQGLLPYEKKKKKKNVGKIWSGAKVKEYIQEYTNYPTQILDFSNENKTVQLTQKPVPLMEYLIKTYSNEGDTVLDFTMGSGTTGVACKRLNRRFIGIELDKKYFKIAENRINEKDEETNIKAKDRFVNI